jgi:hypothetical protein
VNKVKEFQFWIVGSWLILFNSSLEYLRNTTFVCKGLQNLGLFASTFEQGGAFTVSHPLCHGTLFFVFASSNLEWTNLITGSRLLEEQNVLESCFNQCPNRIVCLDKGVHCLNLLKSSDQVNGEKFEMSLRW